MRHGTLAVSVTFCPSHKQKEENPNPYNHMKEDNIANYNKGQPQSYGKMANQNKRRRIFTCDVIDGECPGVKGSQSTTKSIKIDSTTSKTDAGVQTLHDRDLTANI